MSVTERQDFKDKAEGASLRLGPSACIAGAGVGILALVLYLSTLAPTVLHYTADTKDAPVLPVAAYVLGISHPTGYPTYTILTHLFAYLPVGDVAYRVNLASAVFGALAVAALHFLGLRLGGGIVAAFVGALAFGTSPLFWSQAVIAEIYTLHVLFLALVFLVLLLWRETREDGYLLLAAGVIGLAVTHNPTSGLLLPTAAAFVLLVEPRKVLDRKIILKGVGVFLISLLPYAYLPIRARMDPPLKVWDPSDWEGFRDLVTGGEFKANMWAFGPEELPGRLSLYLHHLTGELPWTLLAAAVVGVAYTLLRDRAAFALLAFPFGGFLFYALEYDIVDVEYYFIPTYAILSLWASVGLAAALRGAGRAAAKRGPGLRTAAVVALSTLVLCVPLWGIRETHREVDRSEDYEGRGIVEAVADDAAPNAVVIQHRSPLQYMRLVEGRREDVTLWGFNQPNDEEEDAEALEAIREGRLYIVPSEGKTSLFEATGYGLVPVAGGTFYRVVPKESL